MSCRRSRPPFTLLLHGNIAAIRTIVAHFRSLAVRRFRCATCQTTHRQRYCCYSTAVQDNKLPFPGVSLLAIVCYVHTFYGYVRSKPLAPNRIPMGLFVGFCVQPSKICFFYLFPIYLYGQPCPEPSVSFFHTCDSRHVILPPHPCPRANRLFCIPGTSFRRMGMTRLTRTSSSSPAGWWGAGRCGAGTWRGTFRCPDGFTFGSRRSSGMPSVRELGQVGRACRYVRTLENDQGVAEQRVQKGCVFFVFCACFVEEAVSR